MEELADTIALAKAGKRDEALALVRTDAGLHRMGQTRQWVAAQQAVVAGRLAAIRAGDEHNAVMFEITALLCSIVAGGWAGLGGDQRVRGHKLHRLLDLNDELNRIFTLSADILAVVDEEWRAAQPQPGLDPGDRAACGFLDRHQIIRHRACG